MKAVIQRVSEARVTVDGAVRGAIGAGAMVLLGVRRGDTEAAARKLAHKTLNLRIFEDDAGRMNRSVVDLGGSLLVISQFTLYADTRKGHRPSFIDAAEPGEAERLYGLYVAALRDVLGEGRVHTGQFGAMMDVALVNHGPVTIALTVES